MVLSDSDEDGLSTMLMSLHQDDSVDDGYLIGDLTDEIWICLHFIQFYLPQASSFTK